MKLLKKTVVTWVISKLLNEKQGAKECAIICKVYTQEIINSSSHCVGEEDLGSGVETCFLLYAPLYFEFFFFFFLVLSSASIFS